MAEWTRADVKAVAPEFTSVGDATLDQYIGWAYDLVNPTAFGNRTVFAGALMTAHLLTTLPPLGFSGGGSAGAFPVQSRTVGSVSVTYAVPQVQGAGTAQGLATSKYGVQFSALVRLGLFSQVL